jgi:hypothetical protein
MSAPRCPAREAGRVPGQAYSSVVSTTSTFPSPGGSIIAEPRPSGTGASFGHATPTTKWSNAPGSGIASATVSVSVALMRIGYDSKPAADRTDRNSVPLSLQSP